MKKCYLDANVLISFINEESLFYQKTKVLLFNLRKEDFQLRLSTLTIDETLYALKKHFLLKKCQKETLYLSLKKFLKQILSLPTLNIINPLVDKKLQIEVVNLMQKYNFSPRDAYHLFTAITNDIDCLATFDKDFERIKEVKVVGLE